MERPIQYAVPPLPVPAHDQDRSGDIHYLEFLAATIEAVGGMEVGVGRFVVGGREQVFFFVVSVTRQVFALAVTKTPADR